MSEKTEQLCTKYAMLRELLIKKGYRLHHSSLRAGYVSRTKWVEGSLSEYDGKFGKGYTLRCPNWRTTHYHTLEYWIDPRA